MDKNHIKHASKADQGGYSLIELIVVLAVVGVLAAIAVPDMRGWFGKRDLDSSARTMFADFQRARSEAIRSSRTVTITVNTGGNWYSISDSAGTIVPQTTMPASVSIDTANTNGFPYNFSSRGFSADLTSAQIRITSTRAPSGSNWRQLTLTPGGSMSILP